ncbi:Tetraspanin-18 [Apostasia shenzhenica]|uniref:Tetraspanin-18 n=1 Tax=Apostasia shenzhenica TaxID=1088818 RepID=A0A2I0BC92_9ASPA|nr:Tetraspanin-18 [Apostasia shenzhenica]
MLRPNCCRSCLAFLLEFLNFLQTFVGVSILIYSIWILNSSAKHDFGFSLDLDGLPAPWFVCALMGVGISLCLVAFTGLIAAESISSCCLCFHAILSTILMLFEAALVGYLVFKKEWKKDVPNDSTGELERLIAFIEENMDIVKWIGVSIIVIQALSLFLAVLIRALIPSTRLEYDSDEDYYVIRRPLLNQQVGQTFEPTSGFHSAIWSSRMKDKYGLIQNHFGYNATDPKSQMPTSSNSDEQSPCSIL